MTTAMLNLLQSLRNGGHCDAWDFTAVQLQRFGYARATRTGLEITGAGLELLDRCNLPRRLAA